MAETSGFFEAELNEETGQWDREYFAHQFASYFKLFFGNGVFGSPTNQLKVLAGDGLKVIIKAGWAFIEGYWYFNEADLELTIDPNTTAFDRQDSIMCRLDMASKKITSVALAGVTDVVRDGNYYDLKLASVIVGVAGTSISNANIVDTRTDQTVCGLVTGVMKVQPTADLFAQFTAQFNLWFETIKGQLSGDVAGNLQNQIGSLPDLKTSVKSSLVEAINELTQKEVDVLDTYEEIMANTTLGKAAGSVGVKQGFTQLNDSLTADNAQAFQFAYDSASGKYGYKVKEADTDVFVPFNSNWRIEDIYAYRASNGYCWLHYVVNTVGINTLKCTMTSAGTSSALAMYDDNNNLLINDAHKLTEKTYTHDVSSYSKVIIVAINSGTDQAVRLVNFEYIA